jgi:hypothetical protein
MREKRREIRTVGGVSEMASLAGREERLRTEIRHADDEIRDQKYRRTIEAVGALFDENGAVFEESGDVCDCHEGHERRTEEL